MALKGKCIVFTGTLEMTRAEVKKAAEAAGATVGSSITGKTEILVAGEGAGSKKAAAEAKGLAVWTEDEFRAALTGKPGGGKKKPLNSPAGDAPNTKKAKPAPKLASTVVSTTGTDGGAVADTDAVAAAVDAGVTEASIAVVKHHKLVLVDVANNSDKYFVVQLLTGVKGGRKKQTLHFIFTRWGRTGTKGQVRAGVSPCPTRLPPSLLQPSPTLSLIHI